MPFGKGRPSGRSWELKKNSVFIFALCLLMASFAGCGYSPSDSNNKASSSTVGSLDPRDLASPPRTEDGITVEAPQNNFQNPNAPVDPLSQAGHFEPRPGGMLGSLGMNLDTYFSEDIQDPIVRIKRLERALTAIQGDLKTVAPPIQRLVAVESDIQELVTQLEILLENDSQPSSPAPVQTLSVPKPETVASPASPPLQLAENAGAVEEVPEQRPPEKQAIPPPTPPPVTVATPPPQAVSTPPPEVALPPPPAPSPVKAEVKPVMDTGTPSVTDLRVGEHTDKVRLVLDLTANTAFTADLDNGEHILVIELPAASWTAAKTKDFGNSPLLKSYTVESGGKGEGSMLILQLKNTSAILAQQKIEGEGGHGQRIVIDLKL